MGKWKPAHARKKASPAPSTGRLISCLLLLAVGFFLFFLLFAAILRR